MKTQLLGYSVARFLGRGGDILATEGLRNRGTEEPDKDKS